MMALSPHGAFLVYLLSWFFMLAVLWGRELWRRKVYDWALSEGSLCVCDECRFAFLVKPGESVSRCPRCGEICAVKRKKA